jgi:hypothetical protein
MSGHIQTLGPVFPEMFFLVQDGEQTDIYDILSDQKLK